MAKPLTELVCEAVQQRRDRIDGLRHGRVEVEVQDGVPVLVRTIDHFRPTVTASGL